MMAKFSLTKGKSIYIVDLILIPLFVLIIYSGLKLHIARHEMDYNHNVWSYWAHYHVIISILSIITVYFHVKAHWGWYKGLIKKGIGKKSKVTLGLSALFLILIITGIVLVLFIEGANSSIGLWHYRLGLLITLLLIVHFLTRLSQLIKGLKQI